MSVAGAGAGTLTCGGNPAPVNVPITGSVPAGGNSAPFTLTCNYANMADGAVITAVLNVRYTTNGLQRVASGSPATISFTIRERLGGSAQRENARGPLGRAAPSCSSADLAERRLLRRSRSASRSPSNAAGRCFPISLASWYTRPALVALNGEAERPWLSVDWSSTRSCRRSALRPSPSVGPEAGAVDAIRLADHGGAGIERQGCAGRADARRRPWRRARQERRRGPRRVLREGRCD